MRNIIIACSSKFYEEVLNLKIELEEKGYNVLNYPKKINIDTEYKNAYENFYKDIEKTDDFLLFNLDKNGVEGYIGYESFAEMSYLVANNILTNNNDRKIFIYKMPDKKVGCYMEIEQFLKLGYIELYKNNLN